MDPRTIRRCREFIADREVQKSQLAIALKMQIARDHQFEEVGRRLGELKPFIEYFYEDMISRYGTAPRFYEHCGISRQVYAQMQRDNYDPRIETVYKIIIGLHMNLLDASILLENAGYSFTFKSITQLVIIFCIIKEIYDPLDVDELLTDLGEPVLFAIE